MSDRFSSLRDNIKNEKNREKNREKNLEKNTFKSRDRQGNVVKKNKNKNESNIFTKDKKIIKEKIIDTSEQSFPSLNPCIQIEKPKLINYLETTKKIKEEKQKKKSIVPPGWTVLHKNISFIRLNIENEVKISPYYNPSCGLKILEEREKYREELNEILGDISPYWDMSWLEDDIDWYESDDEDIECEEEWVDDW